MFALRTPVKSEVPMRKVPAKKLKRGKHLNQNKSAAAPKPASPGRQYHHGALREALLDTAKVAGV
jgi:hypothetical protein